MKKKGWGKCEPFLIDGFPRNQENVTVFDEHLKYETNLIGVLNFEVDAETMRQRCLARGQGRADDNEATIQKRLNKFIVNTVPVINKMKENGNFYTIDATKSKEEVSSNTFEAVNKILGAGIPNNRL